MNFAQPLSADTLVSAAVSVVLPWSMCPMVPTFTCGLLRSNFSLAMSAILVVLSVPFALARRAAGADDQDRTGDLVLTKDALCQLSYIGLRLRVARVRVALRPISRPSLRASSDCLAPSAGLPAEARSRIVASEGWSGRRGSNPRPTAWKAVTLPLSYSRLRAHALRCFALRRASPPSSSLCRRPAAPSRNRTACHSRLRPVGWLANRSSLADPSRAKVGGEGRTRTFEAARATDLQSAAFDRFATSPAVCVVGNAMFRSYLRPADVPSMELAKGFEPPTG